MENEIVKSNGHLSTIHESMDMAKAFAESGMFPDIKMAAQAFVKIQAGNELGIPPFAAMSGIHIIQGKTTLGAGLMASRVKASGKYDYKVIQQDDKVCSIDFYQGKEKLGNSTFTIEDAKKAGTKNIDKFPKNMLFARAVSNGVKWYVPDVFTGPVYVTGEITEDATYELMPDEKKISAPSPDQPPMTDNDLKYRTPTMDAEVIVELIDHATDPKLLKVFQAVNGKFFKSNPELEERLKTKGNSLIELKKSQQPS